MFSQWTYPLPDHAIARFPPDRRDGGKLLGVPAGDAAFEHLQISDLVALIAAGDLLVVNNSRVLQARLRAHRKTGGAVELLLLGVGPGDVDALARPARRLRAGESLLVGPHRALLLTPPVDGIVRVRFDADPLVVMSAYGEVPLPPYLHRDAIPSDQDRYQTVYADPPGSVAAPTAGLHLTQAMLVAIAARGAEVASITLHVGPGTFRPLDPGQLESGVLHSEAFDLPEATVSAIERTRARGGRVIAVGTTTTRVLEANTPVGTRVPVAGSGRTSLFIRPPYEFRCVDALLTNLHLPESSLLMLVGAWCGRERLLAAYAEAVRSNYRFYSYGDAMWLT